MNSKNLLRGLGIALLAVAAFIVIGVLTFAGPCVHEDGSFGVCFTAAEGIVGAGIALVGVALAGLLVTNPKARGVLAIVAACLGLFIMFSPGSLFELCMMETMHCRAVMQPFALVCGGIATVISAVMAVAAFRSK